MNFRQQVLQKLASTDGPSPSLAADVQKLIDEARAAGCVDEQRRANRRLAVIERAVKQAIEATQHELNGVLVTIDAARTDLMQDLGQSENPTQ